MLTRVSSATMVAAFFVVCLALAGVGPALATKGGIGYAVDVKAATEPFSLEFCIKNIGGADSEFLAMDTPCDSFLPDVLLWNDKRMPFRGRMAARTGLNHVPGYKIISVAAGQTHCCTINTAQAYALPKGKYNVKVQFPLAKVISKTASQNANGGTETFSVKVQEELITGDLGSEWNTEEFPKENPYKTRSFKDAVITEAFDAKVAMAEMETLVGTGKSVIAKTDAATVEQAGQVEMIGSFKSHTESFEQKIMSQLGAGAGAPPGPQQSTGASFLGLREQIREKRAHSLARVTGWGWDCQDAENANRKAVIAELPKAQLKVARAYNWVSEAANRDTDLYVSFFGANRGRYPNRVKEVMQKTFFALNKMTYRNCDLKTMTAQQAQLHWLDQLALNLDQYCEPNVYGYVWPSAHGANQVTLCPQWNNPVERLNTLVHETSHNQIGGDTTDVAPNPYTPSVYTGEDRTSAEKTENAENYSDFIANHFSSD